MQGKEPGIVLEGTCVSQSFGELATTGHYCLMPAAPKQVGLMLQIFRVVGEDACLDFFFFFQDSGFEMALKLFLTVQPNKTSIQLFRICRWPICL